MASFFICPLCDCYSPTLKLYVSHLRVSHSKDPSFNVMCGVGGCREVFRAFSAFNAHIYRHHRSEIGVSSPTESGTCSFSLPTLEEPSGVNVVELMESPEGERQNNLQDDHFQEVSSTSIPVSALQQTCSSSDFSRKLTAANLILQLREGHQVSQVAISEVVSGCRSLCNEVVNELKSDVIATLSTNGPVQEDIALVLNKDFDPFKNIDTNYLFEKFCMDHLGCLVRFIVKTCYCSL